VKGNASQREISTKAEGEQRHGKTSSDSREVEDQVTLKRTVKKIKVHLYRQGGRRKRKKKGGLFSLENSNTDGRSGLPKSGFCKEVLGGGR